MQTGRCLDDSLLGLRQAPCNGTQFQQFVMTTLCVEDARRGFDGVRAFPCNTSPHQNWVWM